MKKQKFAKIQEVLTEMAESGEAAGGNCLIFRHGEECCYYEAGYADQEKKIPIKRDTIFRLYSMTKPMTAVGAMLLVQDGKLDLRERVCQDDFCKFSKFKYLSAEKSPNISCLHIS